MTNDSRNAVARATKSRLRQAARVSIAAMTDAERKGADEAICARLLGLSREVRPAFVVAYLALPDEVNLERFVSGIDAGGALVLVPRVRVRGEIGLARWSPGCALEPDLEGVPSPLSTADRPSGRALVVVPGRVFDTEGGRVGRGRGYYDRFLASAVHWATSVGTAYECQIAESVPREPHDAGVEWLVTESGARRVASRKERE